MNKIGKKVKIIKIDDSVVGFSIINPDTYLNKTGTIIDLIHSINGTIYKIKLDDNANAYEFFCETELELVNNNNYVLELGDLFIYNEVDSDGYIKIVIEDGKVNSEYVHVSELDIIIKFLENIKNIEDKRMGK